MTDQRQGTLNPIAVNCLRTFSGVGATVVFGARTLEGADGSLPRPIGYPETQH